MNKLIDSMICKASKQGYGAAYYFQSVPLIGAIVSIPTAVVSGIAAITKFAQAIFKKIIEQAPFFQKKDNLSTEHSAFFIQQGMDLSLIFVNNLANIATLGILNSIIVWYCFSSDHLQYGGMEAGFYQVSAFH